MLLLANFNKEQLKEIEWRLNFQAEKLGVFREGGGTEWQISQ